MCKKYSLTQSRGRRIEHIRDVRHRERKALFVYRRRRYQGRVLEVTETYLLVSFRIDGREATGRVPLGAVVRVLRP